MAYAPPDSYNTRADLSILLERPLTMGEMRANVLWRARRWANMGSFLFSFILSYSLWPPARLAGGGAPLPRAGGGGAGPSEASTSSARSPSVAVCPLSL